MALLDETFPPSYKGASFLVAKSTTNGGRKGPLHEFPDSDRQNFEDLGLKPRTLTINGIINSPNYTRKKERLLSAIESKGKGLLVHPFFGNLENMVCRTFILDEDFSELGDAKITMVFTVSNDIAIPQGTENTASFLNGLNNTLQGSMNSDLATGFSVSNLRDSFIAATDTMNRMFDTIDEKTKIVAQSIEAADAFSSLINSFATNINDLARKPQEFADAMTNIYQNINGLYAVLTSVSLTGNQSVTTASNQSIESTKTLNVFEAMFDFDDDLVIADNTTNSRIERNLNNALMQQSMQLSSLGFAYLNSAQIQFSTVDNIDDVAIRLEKQYQKLLLGNDNIHELLELNLDNKDIDQTTILALQDLRDATQSFFNEAKLTTNKVIEVFTPEISASLLTYRYYGDLDLESEIIELNGEQDVSFFSDEVNILSL